MLSVYKKSIICLLFLVSSTGTSVQGKETWMTVFIHGVVRPQFCKNNLLHVMRDHVENTSYERAVAAVRNDRFFQQFHAIQGLGLKPIDLIKQKINSGAYAIARLYDAVLQTTQKEKTINRYYTFGWSGLLSEKTRYRDAKQLYQSLEREIERLRKRDGITPKVRIISYSHGGNILLNLARVKKEEQCALCLTIDEATFIGVPIIRETDHYVDDPMFKKIYLFYSPDDQIQTKDVFSFKRLCSQRTFHNRTDLRLPDSLRQIRIKVVRYRVRNHHKDDHDIMNQLTVNKDPKHKFKKISCSPGHTELWYLGWTSSFYRNKFPLFPLPVIVVTPAIIDALNHMPILYRNVEIELHPQRSMARIGNRKSKQRTTVPFLANGVLESIQQDAYQFKPAETLKMEYKRRVKAAKADARKKEYTQRELRHQKRYQELGLCFRANEIM